MLSAVVCDDDSDLRHAISERCEQAGLQVIAETDNAPDAVALVRRFSVDVLIMDRVLGDTSGDAALLDLQDLDPHPAVIVFTAYASHPAELLRMGATEVVEKPALGRLSEVLDRLARGGATSAAGAVEVGAERRRIIRSVEPLADLWRSPSGISSANDLGRSLDTTVEGDTLLVLTVEGLDELEAHAGQVVAADCRLAPARLLRATLRTQDVVHEVPAIDGFVGVLRGGDTRAATCAWQRLSSMAGSAELPGELRAVCAPVGATGAREALARAVAALQAAPPDTTELLSA